MTQKFLVTGGTGFMGRNIIDNLVAAYPDCEIVSLSRTWDRIKPHRTHPNVTYVYGDIINEDDIHRAFGKLNGVVSCVFHCAAFKDVVTGEDNVNYLTRINIDGTENVIRASMKEFANKIVLISTDKAVSPQNAYGHTKAIMESYVSQYKDRIDICFVRYGNVWASTGSVGDVWYQKSLVSGSILLLTDPDMTRFWLSKKQAWDIVNYAFLSGESGWGYVPNAKSSTMKQVADVFLSLYQNIVDVQIVGWRPGEKLHESMLGRNEPVVRLGDIYGIPPSLINNLDIQYLDLSSDTVEKMTDDEIHTMVIENDTRFSI